MNEGYYIVGNDLYAPEVRALTNSLRCHDPDGQIYFIPYDDQCDNVIEWLDRVHGVPVFPDLTLLDTFTDVFARWFDYPGAPPNTARSRRLRNLACWFGPFDRFIYLDADILVFENLREWFAELATCDLLACDGIYRHGTRWVFNDSITDVFPASLLARVFNGGFWISRRGLFRDVEELLGLIEAAKAHRGCFDFSSGVLAQPLINFLVLSKTERVRNLLREQLDIAIIPTLPHLEARGTVVFAGERRCPYLHWVGPRIAPEVPFYDLWCYYRDLYGN